MRTATWLLLLTACSTASTDAAVDTVDSVGTTDSAASAEGEPYFELDRHLACDRDVIGLEGGLHAHLLKSRDGGRRFDYQSARPLEDRVKGSYDLESGAFTWTRTYAEPYFRSVEEVSGQGTAYTDGDLDVDYDRRVERRAGGSTVRHQRIQRHGCDEQRVESNAEGVVVSVEQGVYGKKGYVYTTDVMRDGAKTTLSGTLAWDRTSTEHEAWRVGDHEYVADTTDDGQGKVDTTYREVTGATLVQGTTTQRPNGTEHHVFTQTAANYAGDWDYTVDVDGAGSGSLHVRPSHGAAYDCDVVVTDGECTFTCPGENPIRC